MKLCVFSTIFWNISRDIKSVGVISKHGRAGKRHVEGGLGIIIGYASVAGKLCLRMYFSRSFFSVALVSDYSPFIRYIVIFPICSIQCKIICTHLYYISTFTWFQKPSFCLGWKKQNVHQVFVVAFFLNDFSIWIDVWLMWDLTWVQNSPNYRYLVKSN